MLGDVKEQLYAIHQEAVGAHKAAQLGVAAVGRVEDWTKDLLAVAVTQANKSKLVESVDDADALVTWARGRMAALAKLVKPKPDAEEEEPAAAAEATADASV